jgi:hypothetical protein
MIRTPAAASTAPKAAVNFAVIRVLNVPEHMATAQPDAALALF